MATGTEPPGTPAEVVRALSDPGAYAHPVERVELIETHISWVFLAGERVYKVKKPVDLGFLDFTTLERRRFYCEEEVRLNRRLTHDVYLGVVELTGPSLRIGGRGAVREVAVEMRRLPQERMLDRLVRDGRAEPGLLDAIGGLVGRFHVAADTGGAIDELGGLDTVRANWRENFEQTEGLAPDVLPDDWRRALLSWVGAFTDREAERFARRVRGGRSRDCHGDLQAQHVCCAERVQIFDCIEFNHRFRYGDVAADVTFLAMDLDRLDRPDLALRFLNAWLEETADYEAVPLLDFYRAYRAFVRGKVLGFMIAARPDAAAKARERFALAHRYTLARPAPRLLVTSGVIGTGKSTIAREVAARVGAILVRTDVVRKRLAGMAPTERHAASFGEGLYTPAMSGRTYAECLRLADELLGAGWSVVVDGAFATAGERDRARALAARRGVAVTVLWCDAPDRLLTERLRRRAATPGEVSDAGPELLAAHRSRYEPPTHERGVVRVDTTIEPDSALRTILSDLM